MPGTLYVVSTPIGNLEDITHRAVRILGEVDLIACEDTRHTRKLLERYGIKTRTISYHEHNEQERSRELVDLLADGTNLAIVSDAGTPGISDPGFRLVRLAIAKQLPVVPVPGPNALITALVASGLPTDEFFFGGFLPARSGARQARLNELRSIPGTLIFYEAPNRLAAALSDAHEILGERQAVVARELTKLHEEIGRGRLSELATRFSSVESARGEIVLIIDRKVIEGEPRESNPNTSIGILIETLEKSGLDHRPALKKSALEPGPSPHQTFLLLCAQQGPNWV